MRCYLVNSDLIAGGEPVGGSNRDPYRVEELVLVRSPRRGLLLHSQSALGIVLIIVSCTRFNIRICFQSFGDRVSLVEPLQPLAMFSSSAPSIPESLEPPDPEKSPVFGRIILGTNNELSAIAISPYSTPFLTPSCLHHTISSSSDCHHTHLLQTRCRTLPSVRPLFRAHPSLCHLGC
jgi:hypothetical protein